MIDYTMIIEEIHFGGERHGPGMQGNTHNNNIADAD